MFSKSRNAQISIFVIIGAIIILGGVFLFTVDFEGITIFDDQRSSYLIREYVESCVEGQTKEGVYLLGVHGGWLYNDIREEFFLTKDTNEYLIKDKLGYVDMGGIEQPYWYYYDDGDEEFRTNIPEFDTKNEYSMKNQLKRYLDETLEPLCIKNFQSFKDKFEVEYDKSEISHEVIFNEDEIIVRLNLPLEIRELNEESTEYIDTFSIDHPNELYVPYHLAKDIIDAESNSSFVEYKLMGLLTPYQDPNSVDLLPPFYDIELRSSPSFVPRLISDIKDLIGKIFSGNIGVIRFEDTYLGDFEVPEELEGSLLVEGIYKTGQRTYLKEFGSTYEENPKIYREYARYSVSPYFDSFIYPLSLKISPSWGNILYVPENLIPGIVSGIIPIALMEHAASYEITNPVLFRIIDTDSDTDFEFTFMIESNIAHNTPLKEQLDLGQDIDSLSSSNEESSLDTLICDPPQRDSGYYYLNLTDPVKKGEGTINTLFSRSAGVEDAFIDFNCKGITSCFIGETEVKQLTPYRNVTELAFKLPTNCPGSTLTVSKFGYKKIEIDGINPQKGIDVDLGSMYLSSSKEMKLNVLLRDPDKSSTALSRSLLANENGFLLFEHKAQDEFVKTVQFNSSNLYDLYVDLIPGNYSVTGFVFYTEDNYTIPGETICVEKDPIFGGCDKYQDIPDLELGTWPSATLEIDFEVETLELIKNDLVEITLIESGIPRNLDEFQDAGRKLGDAQEYASEPKLKYLN